MSEEAAVTGRKPRVIRVWPMSRGGYAVLEKAGQRYRPRDQSAADAVETCFFGPRSFVVLPPGYSLRLEPAGRLPAVLSSPDLGIGSEVQEPELRVVTPMVVLDGVALRP